MTNPQNLTSGQGNPCPPKHLMALNAFRSGNKGHACCLPLSEYDKLIAYPWLHEAILQIRGEHKVVGKDMTAAKLKSQLPFRCAHYYRFIGDKRRQANIDPESFLFQTSVDIDDASLVDTAIEMARMLDTEECIKVGGGKSGTANGESVPNPWRGMLLHMEYSARKKLHIDIRMPIGMTIEEAQRAYCDALGVPCDESCFSPERIIFITDKESEIYRSPMWYAVLPDEELARRREAFLKRGLSIDGRKVVGTAPCSSVPKNNNFPVSTLNSNNNSNNNPNKNETKPSSVGGNQVPPASLSHPSDSHPTTDRGSAAPHSDGSHYGTDKSLIAFDLFRKQANLEQIDINQEGSRHSSLLAILSAGASRVMNESDMRRVVAIRMPDFAQEHDCQQLIHDFYAKYGDSSKPFSRDVIRINAEAEQRVKSEERRAKNQRSPYVVEGNSMALVGTSGSNGSADGNSEEPDYPAPPEMPKKLPKLIELLISRTPELYKPAVAHAVFPPLATHLWRTRFRYIDNEDHEATLMCVLLAGTGSGKNCVHKPIHYIMADIKERDRENLARERAWKDEITRKGANKDKRKRPDNLVIQTIDADMTNPAFVMRTAEAQEHFLYTSLNEIDQFDALKGTGKQQFRIMCLAFDPENEYGQTRVGAQSVTERVCVRFNWNASTTIQKGQQYFSRVLTDGPVSRINFCTIPEREIGAEMPRYGTYGEDFAEQLRPYIENLCKASGLVDCPEAFQLAEKLKDENADFARLSQSRIFENLSFRANVIAYLKACVLYVANGMKWEPEIEEFIRWSEQYDLYCKMRFFGDAIEKRTAEGDMSSKRGPQSLLQSLPDEFSLQQVEALRAQMGMSAKGTKNMLRQWVFRGYIQAVDGRDSSYSCYSYRKVNK